MLTPNTASAAVAAGSGQGALCTSGSSTGWLLGEECVSLISDYFFNLTAGDQGRVVSVSTVDFESFNPDRMRALRPGPSSTPEEVVGSEPSVRLEVDFGGRTGKVNMRPSEIRRKPILVRSMRGERNDS